MSSSTVSQDNDSGCHSLAILPQHVLILPGIARKFSVLLPGQVEKRICQEYFIEQRKDKNYIRHCKENKIRSESTFFRNTPCAKLVLLLANMGDDEQQSLQEVGTIDAPDFQDDAELWVQVASTDLAITVVTEAKYIDAANLATKGRESHKQLRDTLRRVAGAVMETPARLDCAVWLARLSDLLVDGVMFPASASLDLPAWRRAVRERQCSIELRGYSHVFVSGPVDTSDCTARTRLPEADGTSFDAYQEVFGRDRVRELVLCYHRQGDPTGIRRDSGEEGWNGGSVPHGPNERRPGPSGPAAARGRRVPRDEDGQGRASESRQPDARTEPHSAASGAGSLLLDPPIGTPPRTSSIIGTTPEEVTHDQPETSDVHEDDRRWSYPGVARWVAAAPARTDETADDLAWLRQIEEATKIALHQFHLQAKILRSVLTPNAALLKFRAARI